jgi:hypothetical protein
VGAVYRHGIVWQGEEQLRFAAEVVRALRDEEEENNAKA